MNSSSQRKKSYANNFETPQYDDNGDGSSWEGLIPYAQNGNLGMNSYL